MSQYIVIIHGIDGQQVTDALFAQLDQLKKVKDQYKRKFLNDRIFSLITYWKSSANMERNQNLVIFLGKDIEEFALSKGEQRILNEFDLPGLIMQHGEYFDLDYLADLLYNDCYQDVVHMNKNCMTHYQMTPTKRKQIEKKTEKSFDLEGYLSSIDRPIVVYGVSSVIKKTKSPKDVIIGKRLDNDQLWKEIDRLRMQEKILVLQQIFDMFDNPATQSRIVVGKALKKAIKYSLVEKVCGIDKMVTKIRRKFNPDQLNFPLIEVKSIETNDPVKRLIDDFDGVIGLTYY